MKYCALFLFVYFSALTVLPTVKAMKSHFASTTESTCHKNNSAEETNGACQKEKCLLNFNMNQYTYVLFTNHFELKNNTLFVPQKENVEYHKNFISFYDVTIWQPPESPFVA